MPDVKAVVARAPAKERRFLLAAFLVLSTGLALLALMFFTGESRRARLLAEYEADRMTPSLLDACTEKARPSIFPA